MKAILEYNLPEDDIQHRNAVDAPLMVSLLQEILEIDRKHFKYGPSEFKSDAELLVEIRRKIYEQFPDIHER